MNIECQNSKFGRSRDPANPRILVLIAQMEPYSAFLNDYFIIIEEFHFQSLQWKFDHTAKLLKSGPGPGINFNASSERS